MNIKTFEAQYELIEFNHYTDCSDNPVDVLDFVIKSNDIDFIQDELEEIFVVNMDKNSYVFSEYEPIECYDIGGGLTRAICVK